MKGAIFYASKHGSTAEYARWIGEATELPVFAVEDSLGDPADYDFLVLGSPIYFYKPIIRNWLREHEFLIRNKPTIFFTVSGAGAGPKLDGWVGDSLATSLLSHMDHVGLRGRWRREELTRLERILLTVGGLMNRDRQARKDELEGFDYMDKSSIGPVVEKVKQLQTSAPVAVAAPGG